MLKMVLFFILLAFILAASYQQGTGQVSSSDTVSFEEVKTSIEEQGLVLKEIDLPKNNVFIQKLNGVSPEIFSLEGMTLSIYIFSTVNDRKEGMKAFKKATATIKARAI